MRSGVWLLILMLTAVGCRGGNDQAEVPAAIQVASTPTTKPVASVPIEGTPYRATPLNPLRSGVIVADDTGAAINLRSQPTTQSAVTGTGTVGDQLELLKLAEGEGGYSWYFVRFVEAGSEGWIRGDFIDTASEPVAAVPTNPCGESRQRAFFETETFASYICETDASLRFIGINKTNQKSFTTEEVETSQGTYIAIDGNIQYHLNDATLAVYRVQRGEYTQLLGESVMQQQR